MKYKNFRKRIKHIVNLSRTLSDRDFKLEKAFGGDTSILTNDAAIIVDKMSDQLAKEMKDKNGVLDELIYDKLLHKEYTKDKFSIIITNKKTERIEHLPATIKSVYKYLRKNV